MTSAGVEYLMVKLRPIQSSDASHFDPRTTVGRDAVRTMATSVTSAPSPFSSLTTSNLRPLSWSAARNAVVAA